VSGTVPMAIRDLLRQLANEAVPTECMSAISGYVLRAFGFTLVNSVSA
jgi:hypothetical protein